jgi:trehalose 6-phosphate synthase/phosphatase
MMSDRVLIVANRLPVQVRVGSGGIELVPSSGGLATGLRPWHQMAGGIWFGWPGENGAGCTANRALVDERLHAARMTPVHLSADQVAGHYHGFANRVLWPLFHYSIDRVPIDAAGWDAYRSVNEAFAEEVAREYRPGDVIWVHDYHLMLLPALLRERLPRARIGFFLHIPFPASEVFRVLPWRRDILQGLLGADLIGFHTFGYMRHFMTSLLHVEGVEGDVDRVRVGDRDVTIGVFPMGVDAASFAAQAQAPEVRARVDAIRREAAGRRIVLGVDRLDYTKGIPRRLEAIAQVLEREPGLRDRMRYIQVAVPSRGATDSYRRFRCEVEETVGRLNGTYGTLQSLPIHYVHQTVTLDELVALYCAADVMLVTPLRDGMNLVAKEFAASRVDEDGVLVLSEFAGAAAELQGAVTVNPYDVDALAATIQRGLSMPVEEQRARMRALRRRVCDNDVFAWADRFVQRLRAMPASEPPIEPSSARSLAAVLVDLREATGIRLLLDYDSTLVPPGRGPERATPDDELLLTLEDLTCSRGVQVDIVSGYSRDVLERWFGDLPVSLWAEHGFWRRPLDRDTWEPAASWPSEWMARVKPILDQFAASTPGARVQVQTASIAWHYDEAARDFGMRQAHELRLLLGDLLSNQPVEVLEGRKVVEVRLRGVNKGDVVQRIRSEAASGVTIVAFGDDRSGENLFRALPPGAVSVAVGRRSAAARFHLDDYRDVRQLLLSLVEDRHSYEPRYLTSGGGYGESHARVATTSVSMPVRSVG